MVKRNNKNILLVANWKSDVGYAWWLMENFWVQISDQAAKAEKRCFLIYPELRKIPSAIASSSIETSELNYNYRSLLGFIKLAKFVRGNKIDCIYLTDKPFFSLRYLLLRMIGVSSIVAHDHTPGERSTPKKMKKLLKKLKNRLPLVTASAQLAVTEYVSSRQVLSACIPASKVHVAKNGIVPIGRDSTLKHYAHSEFNIPKGATIVFTSGRASYYKGIDFIIECANALINQLNIENLYFLYCGDGPEIGAFKRLCRDYNLEDRFIFAGARRDVRELVQSCHLGIQASKGEVGYSLSILEYMSAGLATLVSDNPSVCASVKDGESGLIFEEGNVESACSAMLKVIQSKTLRDMISRHGQELVEREYNLVETNRSFNDFWKSFYFDK